MKMKKVLCTVMAAAMVSTAVPSFAETIRDDEKTAALFVNEKWFTTNTPPILVNDRTLAPLRDIAEAMDFDVEWEQTEKKITVTKGDVSFDLFIDRNYVVKDGEQEAIDSAPILHFDTTMVPVRVISEYLSCDVEWDGNRYFVFINSPKTYEYYKNTPYKKGIYSDEITVTGYIEKVDYYSKAFSMEIPVKTVYHLITEDRGDYSDIDSGMTYANVKRIEVMEYRGVDFEQYIGKRVTVIGRMMPAAASWGTTDFRLAVEIVELNEIF